MGLRSSLSYFQIIRLTLPNTRSIVTVDKNLGKAIKDLESNPYYVKYAGKISKLQNTSPEEFLQKIAKSKEKKGK